MASKRAEYKVVVNHEEQYSIWPVDREIPRGYRDEGTEGTQDEIEARLKELRAER